MTEIAIDLIRINQMIQRYGPEADDVRAKLRIYAAGKKQDLFPEPGLAIVFASFGLFAPLNAMAVAGLCLGSIAVSGGITMILELDSPFSGLVRVSAEPMRQALIQIMH